VPGGSYPVTATATSGLPVAFSIDPTSTAGTCSLSGSTVEFTAAGTCMVDANQSGDASHAPAPQNSQTITVGAAAAQPGVSGVSPNSGLISGGTTITITGANFVAGAGVVIGQGNGPVTGAIAATNVAVVSPTRITATTGGGAKAGTFSVYVSTSGGTSAQVNADLFTYRPPPPTVTGVSPNSGPMGGGTSVTVTGTNFVAGATVLIGQGNGPVTGAIAATNVTVVSPTRITATTGGGAKAGTFSVYVTTSGGTSAQVNADLFTYVGPTPTVTGVSPNSGPIGGGTNITITGTGFVPGSTVAIGQGNGPGFGAIAATHVTVTSSTQITATTGGGAKAGTFSVYVSTPSATSAQANADLFTYR
jgi:hypothetical protein